MSLLKMEEDVGKVPEVRGSCRVGARAKMLALVGELDRQKSLML